MMPKATSTHAQENGNAIFLVKILRYWIQEREVLIFLSGLHGLICMKKLDNYLSTGKFPD
jgi:hypothetical protein